MHRVRRASSWTCATCGGCHEKSIWGLHNRFLPPRPDRPADREEPTGRVGELDPVSVALPAGGPQAGAEAAAVGEADPAAAPRGARVLVHEFDEEVRERPVARDLAHDDRADVGADPRVLQPHGVRARRADRRGQVNVEGLLVATDTVILATSPRTGGTEAFTRGSIAVTVATLGLSAYASLFELIGFEIPTMLLAVWLRFLGRESWPSTTPGSPGVKTTATPCSSLGSACRSRTLIVL